MQKLEEAGLIHELFGIDDNVIHSVVSRRLPLPIQVRGHMAGYCTHCSITVNH